MKISINLLPPERKRRLSTQRLFKVILDQEVKLGIVCVITILALWGVHTIVTQQHSVLMESNERARQNNAYAEVQDLHALFRTTNDMTKTVHAIYNEHIEWRRALFLMGAARPEGITLTEIATEDIHITLKGIAQTPPDLVVFADALRAAQHGEDTCFKNIDIPDEFLAGGQESEFRMTIDIDKQKCLLAT